MDVVVVEEDKVEEVRRGEESFRMVVLVDKPSSLLTLQT